MYYCYFNRIWYFLPMIVMPWKRVIALLDKEKNSFNFLKRDEKSWIYLVAHRVIWNCLY